MARGTYSTSNYFSYAGGLITATPLTMACWVNPFANDKFQAILCISYVGGAGTKLDGWNIRLRNVGDLVAEAGNGSSTNGSLSASALTANVWSHIGGVFASSTSRTAYLNGAAGTANTTNLGPTATTKSAIGQRFLQNNSQDLSDSTSHIAEVGFWNVALTAADMLMLAAGYSPLMVKPESLVAYYPLIRGDSSGDEPDLVGGAKMTEAGTVAVQPHTRVFYPGVPWVVGKPGGAAPDVISPVGIASAEAFGAASISMGISPTGIASAEAFGTAAISLDVSGAGGISSAEAMGQPVLTGVISPTGIASAEALGTAAISLDVSGAGAIPSAEAFGEPTISVGVYIADAGNIASTEALGQPITSVDIAPAGISGAEAFGTPSISLDVSGAGGISSAEAFGDPTITDHGIIYYISEAGGIASAEAFGAASISLDVSGAGGIASAEIFGAPVVSTYSPFNLAVADALVNLASLSDYASKQASISEALIFQATATDSR